MKKLILVFAIVLSVFGCNKPTDVTPTTPVVKDSVKVTPPPSIVSVKIDDKYLGKWEEVRMDYVEMYDNSGRYIPVNRLNKAYFSGLYTKADLDGAARVQYTKAVKSTIAYETFTYTIDPNGYTVSKYSYDATNPLKIRVRTYDSQRLESKNGQYVITNYTTSPFEVYTALLSEWNYYIEKVYYQKFFFIGNELVESSYYNNKPVFIYHIKK